MVSICRFVGGVFPNKENIESGLNPNYYNLSKELVKLGIDVTLISQWGAGLPEKETVSGFDIIRVKGLFKGKLMSPLKYLPLNLAALSETKKIDFDILQLHNFFGSWIQKFCDKPNVLTVHGCDFEIRDDVPVMPLKYGPFSSIGSWYSIRQILLMSNIMCHNATHIVGVAKAVSDELVENFGVKNISFIHNGIDSNYFKKIKSDKFSEFSDFKILYVGSIIPRKGLEFLFQAIKDLDVKLFLVGNCNNLSRIYLNDLMQQYGVKDKIVVLGKVLNQDLPSYYSAADCFVLPTLSEGLPKVVLEAAACKCPVITTNVSGNPELINKKTGLLVESKNAFELKKAIEFVMQNSAKSKKLALNARYLVENEFTWKKAASKYALLYKTLVE